MRSRDTSPEAYKVQIEVFRRMSPERRVELAIELAEDVLRALADVIRTRHPDYDEDQVALALHRMRLGDELFRQAWPNGPLLAP